MNRDYFRGTQREREKKRIDIEKSNERKRKESLLTEKGKRQAGMFSFAKLFLLLYFLSCISKFYCKPIV